MNNTYGTIVTPMERGQITLPKHIRVKLGIDKTTPLSIVLRGEEIVVKPLRLVKKADPYTIKPKCSRKEYLAILKKISKSKTVLWTKEDDIARERMRKKEKIWEW